MPLYEFRCEKCGHVLERLCRMGENGKRMTCPECGGRRMRRLMSVFAAHVSGGSSTKALSGSSCSTCTSGSCATCH